MNYTIHVKSSPLGTEQYDFETHPQPKTLYKMKRSVLASMLSFGCTCSAGCHVTCCMSSSPKSAPCIKVWL